MNAVFQIHFSDDDFCNFQTDLHDVAVENGWDAGGSIKIEHLEDMKALAKDIVFRFGKVATVHVWVAKQNGCFDPRNKIEEYEI